MQIAIESEATARVIEGYLVEHLFESTAEPAVRPAPAPGFQALRVGPFRFLCPVGAVTLHPPTLAPSRVMEASELVPSAYRARLAGMATEGATSIWLADGRIEVRGCHPEAVLELAASAVTLRETRGDSPWIAGSVREPPAFVLDPGALAQSGH